MGPVSIGVEVQRNTDGDTPFISNQAKHTRPLALVVFTVLFQTPSRRRILEWGDENAFNCRHLGLTITQLYK